MISTRSQLGPSSGRTRGQELPSFPLHCPFPYSPLLSSLQWVQSLGPPGVPHTVHQGCGQHCGSRTLWPMTKAGLQQGRAGDTGVQGLCCTHWARRHQAEAQWAGHCLQAVLAEAAGLRPSAPERPTVPPAGHSTSLPMPCSHFTGGRNQGTDP